MDLAVKRSALLRNKLVMRFACVLVAVGFLVSSVVTPRAQAVVVEATAAFGAATATAAINGTCATTLFTGMSTTAASAATVSLMGEYAAATGAASSGAALAGAIGAGTIVTAAGVLVLSAAAGYALYRFIVWLQDEKGLEAGGEAVSIFTPGSVTFQDGSMYIFCTYDGPGTLFSIGSDNVIYNRYFVIEQVGVPALQYSSIFCRNSETGGQVASTLNPTNSWSGSVLFVLAGILPRWILGIIVCNYLAMIPIVTLFILIFSGDGVLKIFLVLIHLVLTMAMIGAWSLCRSLRRGHWKFLRGMLLLFILVSKICRCLIQRLPRNKLCKMRLMVTWPLLSRSKLIRGLTRMQLQHRQTLTLRM